MPRVPLVEMPGYDFRVHAAFTSQVALTMRQHRIRGSRKRAGLMMVHRCWLSVMTAAVAVIPQMGSIIAAASTAENNPASRGPVPLACTAAFRKTFDASSTWQEIIVNGTDKNFTNACEVNVAFTSNASEVSMAYADWQSALLMKVHGLQLLPASSKCGHGNLTLFLYPPDMYDPRANVCDAYSVDALYIWVSETIRLYLFVWPESDIRALFSAAFVAVRTFDVCQLTISSYAILDVDGELYVFAPHSVFVGFLRNRTVCSSSKQLRFAVASPFDALSVTVLAAPTNSSCWWLWLGKLRISGADTRSFIFRTEVTVLYERNNSTSGCISSEVQQGFTLRIIAVAATTVNSTFVVTALPTAATTSITAVQSAFKTTPGSTELKGTSEAIVIGSAVAGLLAVIGVVLLTALLVIRRRRIQRSHNSSHRSTTSVLGHADANATRTVNHLNRPYSGHYQQPHGQHAALFSTSTIASAQTMDGYGADIVMADNDLYGTAFGS